MSGQIGQLSFLSTGTLPTFTSRGWGGMDRAMSPVLPRTLEIGDDVERPSQHFWIAATRRQSPIQKEKLS